MKLMKKMASLAAVACLLGGPLVMANSPAAQAAATKTAVAQAPVDAGAPFSFQLDYEDPYFLTGPAHGPNGFSFSIDAGPGGAPVNGWKFECALQVVGGPSPMADDVVNDCNNMTTTLAGDATSHYASLMSFIDSMDNVGYSFTFTLTNLDTGTQQTISYGFNDKFIVRYVTHPGGIGPSTYTIFKIFNRSDKAPVKGWSVIDKATKKVVAKATGVEPTVTVKDLKPGTNHIFDVVNNDTGDTVRYGVLTSSSYSVYQKILPNDDGIRLELHMNDGLPLPTGPSWRVKVFSDNRNPNSPLIYDETYDGSTTVFDITGLPKDFATRLYHIERLDTGETTQAIHGSNYGAFYLHGNPSFSIDEATRGPNGDTASVTVSTPDTFNNPDSYWSVVFEGRPDASHDTTYVRANESFAGRVPSSVRTFTFDNLDPTESYRVYIIRVNNGEYGQERHTYVLSKNSFTADVAAKATEADITFDTVTTPQKWVATNLDNGKQYISLDSNMTVDSLTPETAYDFIVANGDTGEQRKLKFTTAALTLVTPQAPTIVDKAGTANDSVTAPANNSRITYKLAYSKATGKWTLTATPVTGYTLSTNLPAGWVDNGDGTATLSGNLDVTEPTPTPPTTDPTTPPAEDPTTPPTTGPTTPTVVTPAKPIIVDKAGFKDDSVKAPANNSRITYKLAYSKATGKWTLTATAAKGYVFADGTTTNIQTGQLNVTVPEAPTPGEGPLPEGPIPGEVITGLVDSEVDKVDLGVYGGILILLLAGGGVAFLLKRKRSL